MKPSVWGFHLSCGLTVKPCHIRNHKSIKYTSFVLPWCKQLSPQDFSDLVLSTTAFSLYQLIWGRRWKVSKKANMLRGRICVHRLQRGKWNLYRCLESQSKSNRHHAKILASANIHHPARTLLWTCFGHLMIPERCKEVGFLGCNCSQRARQDCERGY